MADLKDLPGESWFEFGPQDYVPLLTLRFATERPPAHRRLTAQAARRLCGSADDRPHTLPTTPPAQRPARDE